MKRLNHRVMNFGFLSLLTATMVLSAGCKGSVANVALLNTKVDSVMFHATFNDSVGKTVNTGTFVIHFTADSHEVELYETDFFADGENNFLIQGGKYSGKFTPKIPFPMDPASFTIDCNADITTSAGVFSGVPGNCSAPAPSNATGTMILSVHGTFILPAKPDSGSSTDDPDHGDGPTPGSTSALNGIFGTKKHALSSKAAFESRGALRKDDATGSSEGPSAAGSARI